MEKLRDTFGISRVLEPKTAVPTTAWKVDNSFDIKDNECRIKIERIHIERDSFQQFCSVGDYNEGKIVIKVVLQHIHFFAQFRVVVKKGRI